MTQQVASNPSPGVLAQYTCQRSLRYAVMLQTEFMLSPFTWTACGGSCPAEAGLGKIWRRQGYIEKMPVRF